MAHVTQLRTLIVTAVAVIASIDSLAQTIPEFARARPANPIVLAPLVDIPPTSVEDLTTGAQVVADVTLSRAKSYLTADGRGIDTDYEIISSRVLVGQFPTLPRRTPGQSARLILSVSGGEMTIDGYTVYNESPTLTRPRNNGRYLVFLRPFGGKPGHYALFRGGAFEIEGLQLKPLIRRAGYGHKELANLRLDDAVTRISRAAAAKH